MGENQVKTEQFKDSLARKIPTGWQVERLSNFYAFPARNGLYKSAQYYGRGVLMIHMPQMFRGLEIDILDAARVEVNPTELERFELKPGDLVFARRSLNLEGAGRCSLVPEIPEPVTFESSIIRVRLLREHLRPAFANYFLNSEIGFRLRLPLIRQVAVSGVSSEDIASIPILVPPIPEQESIIEIIDTIDEAIAHTTTLIAKLKQMKAGLLHDLLTRGLDENGELRDPTRHPEQFKDSPLGQIPKDWDVRLVGEVFDLQLGKMLSKASKIGHSPFPYLANRNVQWDEVDLSNLEWMDFNDNEREKFSLLPGDLLVCEGGESGRTAIWKGEMKNCYFQKAIHRLRPKDSQVLPDYMLRFMRQAFEHRFLTSFTSQTSITHLTREKFALLPLPLPKVEEQKAIVNALDSLDTRIRTEEAYRDKLKLQKQGLMQDLLTGKVRVKI